MSKFLLPGLFCKVHFLKETKTAITYGQHTNKRGTEPFDKCAISIVLPALWPIYLFFCINFPFGNGDQLSVDKQSFLNRYPQQSDGAVGRRQPNKRLNQNSASLQLPGLCCHVKSHNTILFYSHLWSSRKVIWMSAAKDSRGTELSLNCINVLFV